MCVINEAHSEHKGVVGGGEGWGKGGGMLIGAKTDPCFTAS